MQKLATPTRVELYALMLFMSILLAIVNCSTPCLPQAGLWDYSFQKNQRLSASNKINVHLVRNNSAFILIIIISVYRHQGKSASNKINVHLVRNNSAFILIIIISVKKNQR